MAAIPYALEDKDKREIRLVALIDDQHLMTMNNNLRVVLWKIPEMTAVYSHRINSELWKSLVLSPNRKYFVTEENNPKSQRMDFQQINFFDALSGQDRGNIPFFVPADAGHAYLVDNKFSPDGKFLLHHHSQGMTLFALEGPQPRKVLNFGIPGGVKDQDIGTVSFAKPGYLLINDRYLFDINKQFIVWRYEPSRHCIDRLWRSRRGVPLTEPR